MRTGVACIALWTMLVIAAGASLQTATGWDSPPTVVITEPLNGTTVSGVVTIRGTASDDVNVSAVYVMIDWDTANKWLANDTSGNGTWATWETTWDSATVPDGWHEITAIAKDTSGQIAKHTISVFTQNGNIQNNPPWVKILTPPSGSTVSGTVVLGGSAGDPDAGDSVELVQVKVNGGPWQDATDLGNGTWSMWKYVWDTTTSPDGWVPVYAQAWDGEVWSPKAWAKYYVDNVPDSKGNAKPWAKILHPKDGETVSGVVLVHGTSGDPDPGDKVEGVWVRVDNGSWNKAVDTSGGDWGTWAWQWNSDRSGKGKHTLCAKSWDGDLYSDTYCITVYVGQRNEKPKVAIVHPKDGETVYGIVLIHGTASDDIAVKSVFVKVDGGAWNKAVDTSPDGSWATWAWEWETSKYADGCVPIYAKAWDGSQYSDVAWIKVCVYNKDDKPTVKITYPKDGDVVYGVVVIQGVAYDDVRVKKVQVRADLGGWAPATDMSGDGSWSKWEYTWDTSNESREEHGICARAWDGKQFSAEHCITLVVVDNGTKGAGLPDLSGALGVATLAALGAAAASRKLLG